MFKRLDRGLQTKLTLMIFHTKILVWRQQLKHHKSYSLWWVNRWGNPQYFLDITRGFIEGFFLTISQALAHRYQS